MDPSSDPAPLRDIPEERLDSWKEIAVYLRRDVRTVQRWEHTKGLPIRRLPGGDLARVYALRTELDGWWNSRGIHLMPEPETPAPQIEVPVPPPRRSTTVRWLTALLMVLGIATMLWLQGGAPRHHLSFKTRDWILIADFQNQTGDPIFDKSLLTAFTVSLEQSPYANIFPRNNTAAALKRMNRPPDARIDETLGRELCQRENVRGLIDCLIAGTGREYVLAARLVDPWTGVAVESYAEHAQNQDQVIDALGRLSTRIRKDLGESLASIRKNNEPLPLVTAGSLAALKFFAEGNHLWRHGQYPEAVKAWELATEQDPFFAMAHAALGGAYMGHMFSYSRAKGDRHYQQALQSAGRITGREQLRIQASYQGNLGHVDEAVEDYRVYLGAFPDDSDVRFGFATLLMLHYRYAEAIAEFREVVRVDPLSARAWIGLATSYRQSGDPVQSLANYARAFALEPSWVTLANLNHEYGFTLVMNGEIPKAEDVFRLALAKPDLEYRALRSLGLLDMYQGKYRDAQSRFERAILLGRDPASRARDHLYLTILRAGRREGAAQVAELDRASSELNLLSDPPVWLYARVGAAYARAGAVARAEQILRRQSARADPQDSGNLPDLRLLEGAIALAKGNRGRAIELFQLAARSSWPPGLAGLARAYQEAGDLREAAQCFGKLLELRDASLGWEPQQDWLEAHAALAEIELAQGHPARAAALGAQLAHLWKDADPDLPLVKRIQQLSKLESSRSQAVRNGGTPALLAVWNRLY